MNISSLAEFDTTNSYKEYSTIGKEYSWIDFINLIESGYLIDYDGSSNLCYDKVIINNMKICIDKRQIQITGKYGSISYMSINNFYHNFVKDEKDKFSVLWYNK